jgi:hypothetical protein
MKHVIRDLLNRPRTWEQVFVPANIVGAGWIIQDFQSHLDPLNQAQVIVTDTVSEVRRYGTTNLDDATPSWSLLETLT